MSAERFGMSVFLGTARGVSDELFISQPPSILLKLVQKASS